MLRTTTLSLAFALLLAGAFPAAAAEPGAGDPLDVTREFYRALHAGDARAAAKLTATRGAEPVLRSFVQLSRAYRSLEEAVAERFGPEAAAEIGYGRKVQAEIKALLGATVEVEGDAARVASFEGRTITTLRRVGGAWRIELGDEFESPEAREAFAAHAKATAAAADHVAAGLRSGRYRTPRDAVADFEERLGETEPGRRPAPEPEGTPL